MCSAAEPIEERRWEDGERSKDGRHAWRHRRRVQSSTVSKVGLDDAVIDGTCGLMSCKTALTEKLPLKSRANIEKTHLSAGEGYGAKKSVST